MKLTLIKLSIGIFLTSLVNNLYISYKIEISDINLITKSKRRILGQYSSSMPNMKINFQSDKNKKNSNSFKGIEQSQSLNGSRNQISNSQSLNGSRNQISNSQSLNGSRNQISNSQSLNGSRNQISNSQSLNGSRNQISNSQSLNGSRNQISNSQSLNGSRNNQITNSQSLNGSRNNQITNSKSLNGSRNNQITNSQSLNGSRNNQITNSQSLNGSRNNQITNSQSLNGSKTHGKSINNLLSESNYRISLKSEDLFKKAEFLRRKNQDKINEILRKFTENQNVKTELSFTLNEKVFSRIKQNSDPTIVSDEDIISSLIIPFKKEDIRSIEFILSTGQPWYLKIFGPNNNEFVEKKEVKSTFVNEGKRLKFIASWVELNQDGVLKILIECDMDISRDDFHKIL